MAEDTIKIPVEIDADVKKLSKDLQQNIGQALASAIDAAIARYDEKLPNVLKHNKALRGGFGSVGEFASHLLEEGRYAPSNATSLAIRRMLNYLVASKKKNLSDPAEMELKAQLNAASHEASDARRQARVAGTYDNLIDLYNVAVRTAENARTPEEKKAALTLAASFKQSLGNRSYVTSGLIAPEQSVSSRMEALAIRNSIKGSEPISATENQVWFAKTFSGREGNIDEYVRHGGIAWDIDQFIAGQGTGMRSEFQKYYTEQNTKAAKELKNFSEALVDAGKVVTVFSRTATEIMQGEWEISRDLIDPVRTRRAVRQQQAQKYGKAVSNFGSSVLAGSAATGNVPGMIVGGVLVAGGEVANFKGSQYEERRLTAETYAERTFDYNSRRMLYGPNINYNTALAAGMSGYTSADAVLNLDTTGANLRGAMAFGAVSENQMMALSLMPNYWRTLMDPNSSTEDKLAAYASDINALPADYQAYINSILPGGDESLRAYTKSGVYGALQAGYATNAQGDALFQQYTAAWEAVQAQKAMQSRTKAIADYAGDTPTLLKHEYSAMGMTTGNVPGLTDYNAMADYLHSIGLSQEALRAEKERKVYNLTVNVGGEEAGKTSFSEKDFESGMSYTLGV